MRKALSLLDAGGGQQIALEPRTPSKFGCSIKLRTFRCAMASSAYGIREPTAGSSNRDISASSSWGLVVRRASHSLRPTEFLAQANLGHTWTRKSRERGVQNFLKLHL